MGHVGYGGAGVPNDDRSGMTAWASHMRGTSRMEAITTRAKITQQA